MELSISNADSEDDDCERPNDDKNDDDIDPILDAHLSIAPYTQNCFDYQLLHSLADDNHELKKKYNDLEAETESLRNLVNSMQIHKRNELGNEEKIEFILIKEATNRENQLRQQLSRLEADLRAEKSESKAIRQEMDRLIGDNERLDEINQSAIEQLKRTRNELKELKVRDLRLEEENGLLEEENVNLQSSISKLKSSMVTYESLQHENENLKDQLAEWKYQLEELTNLKSISDREVEDLYESLKEERQVKYQLKKELSNQLQEVSMAKLNGIVGGISHPYKSESDEFTDQHIISDSIEDVDVLAVTYDDELPSSIHNLSLAAEGLLHSKEAHNMQRKFNDSVIKHNQRLQNILDKMGKSVEVSNSSMLTHLESQLNNVNCNQAELNILRNELDDWKKKEKAIEEELCKPFRLLTSVIDELNQLRPDSDSEFDVTEPEDNLIHSLNAISERIALHVRHLCDYYQSNGAVNDRKCNMSSDDSSDNPEIANRYKNLLAQKRAKISKLRLIIQTDRKTAQIALANLKTKFENEKLAVTETMRNLRNELRIMKEAAASFGRYRALFAARGDEYVEQIEILQMKIQGLEDENAMLNSLLRMAIEQKVNLKDKIEERSVQNTSHRDSTGSIAADNSNTIFPPRGQLSSFHHNDPTQTSWSQRNSMK
ncbi:hypothetical protein GJ496_007773 [Pomphorhynchus laevis]|nr:hypothetical protein GJ496_007773 [Pomphorhynchus laevis]